MFSFLTIDDPLPSEEEPTGARVFIVGILFSQFRFTTCTSFAGGRPSFFRADTLPAQSRGFFFLVCSH